MPILTPVSHPSTTTRPSKVYPIPLVNTRCSDLPRQRYPGIWPHSIAASISVTWWDLGNCRGMGGPAAGTADDENAPPDVIEGKLSKRCSHTMSRLIGTHNGDGCDCVRNQGRHRRREKRQMSRKRIQLLVGRAALMNTGIFSVLLFSLWYSSTLHAGASGNLKSKITPPQTTSIFKFLENALSPKCKRIAINCDDSINQPSSVHSR